MGHVPAIEKGFGPEDPIFPKSRVEAARTFVRQAEILRGLATAVSPPPAEITPEFSGASRTRWNEAAKSRNS